MDSAITAAFAQLEARMDESKRGPIPDKSKCTIHPNPIFFIRTINDCTARNRTSFVCVNPYFEQTTRKRLSLCNFVRPLSRRTTLVKLSGQHNQSGQLCCSRLVGSSRARSYSRCQRRNQGRRFSCVEHFPSFALRGGGLVLDRKFPLFFLWRSGVVKIKVECAKRLAGHDLS